MFARKGVTVFMNGSLQKVDLDAKGRIVNSAPAVEKPKEKLKKNEAIVQLKEKGIKFSTLDTAENLNNLLETAEAIDPDLEAGTGSQEVI